MSIRMIRLRSQQFLFDKPYYFLLCQFTILIHQMTEKEPQEKVIAGRFMFERANAPIKVPSQTNITFFFDPVTQIYEYLWMVLSLAIVGVTVFLFSNVVKFQTHPFFEAVREGDYKDLICSLPIAILFIVVDWFVHTTLDKRCDLYYIDRQKYADPEMRRKRCETLVKWSYSIVYYTFSTLWAYHILLKADILPSFLGGKGIEESWIKNKYSIPQATTEMKIFYMVQFGKHFGRFLNHCFIRREGHLYEYALHHGVSSVLISFSFLTNQWLVGILVLFIHDMSEITFIIGRGYADYKNVNRAILYCVYLLVLVGWSVLKVYYFFIECIRPAYRYYNVRHSYYTEFEIQVLEDSGLFMIIMLVVLLVMQVFWGVLIYKYILTRVYRETIGKPKIQ